MKNEIFRTDDSDSEYRMVFKAHSHPAYRDDPEINPVLVAELDSDSDEIFVWDFLVPADTRGAGVIRTMAVIHPFPFTAHLSPSPAMHLLATAALAPHAACHSGQ